MTMTQWAFHPFKKYASFSGRAPRVEYWGFFLVAIVGGFICGIVNAITGTKIVGALFNLAVLLPSLAVTVRRLHDTNRSGMWYLMVIFGLVVGAVLFAAGGAGIDGFSSGSLSIMSMAGILIMVADAVLLLVLMVLPGTKGPNECGPDPFGEELGEVFV